MTQQSAGLQGAGCGGVAVTLSMHSSHRVVLVFMMVKAMMMRCEGAQGVAGGVPASLL